MFVPCYHWIVDDQVRSAATRAAGAVGGAWSGGRPHPREPPRRARRHEGPRTGRAAARAGGEHGHATRRAHHVDRVPPGCRTWACNNCRCSTTSRRLVTDLHTRRHQRAARCGLPALARQRRTTPSRRPRIAVGPPLATIGAVVETLVPPPHLLVNARSVCRVEQVTSSAPRHPAPGRGADQETPPRHHAPVGSTRGGVQPLWCHVGDRDDVPQRRPPRLIPRAVVPSDLVELVCRRSGAGHDPGYP